MQGESDGVFSEEIANRYQEHLTRLMGLIRGALAAPDLPVAIGRISESGDAGDGVVWAYGDIIRSAQQSFVENDGHAALVTSTDGYSYSDPWHYNSEGFIDLGIRFADALVSLVSSR